MRLLIRIRPYAVVDAGEEVCGRLGACFWGVGLKSPWQRQNGTQEEILGMKWGEQGQREPLKTTGPTFVSRRLCLSLFKLLQQNTKDWVAGRQQKYISHSLGRFEVQDPGANTFSVR